MGILRYPGGKFHMAKRIVERMPRDITAYREPFVGGGSVLMEAVRQGVAKSYFASDNYSPLVAFWMAVHNKETNDHLVAKMLQIKFWKPAPELIKQILEGRGPIWLTPGERFYLRNRCSFSGTSDSGGLSSSAINKRFTEPTIQELVALPELLKPVVFLKADWDSCVTIDGDNRFLFLDPPYYRVDGLYGKNGSGSRFDHRMLASKLAHTKHRFLMTINDCPDIRNLYCWADIESFDKQYGMTNAGGKKNTKKGPELFIRNYQR